MRWWPVENRKAISSKIRGGFVHLRAWRRWNGRRRFVAVAEQFLGVPYVWGGKTFPGLDCSGLIQTSLQAAGIFAPRDTDMMEQMLGQAMSAKG